MGFEPTDPVLAGRPLSRRLPSAGLSQLSRNGALGQIQTADLGLRRTLLYPLSYERMVLVSLAQRQQRYWCPRRGLNSRPPPYQGGTLPAELQGRWTT